MALHGIPGNRSLTSSEALLHPDFEGDGRHVLGRFTRELEVVETHAQQEVVRLHDGRVREVERVEALAKAENWTHEKLMLRRHEVHQQFDPMINEVTGVAWAKSTQLANLVYLRKLKPGIEAMWSDCIRHIMLISDPDVRARREGELGTALMLALGQSLTLVGRSYGGTWVDPWDCDCQIEELERARLAEREEWEQAQEDLRKRNREARVDFKAGGIPETSALYKKIDAYTAHLSLPFVDVKVGYLKSSLKFRLGVKEGEASAAGELELTSDHMRNKRTADFGIEASTKGEVGPAEVEGKVWTKATVTWADGPGDTVVVKDWDVAGGVDLAASAKIGELAGNTASVQATASYQTSILRGNSAAAEVAFTSTKSESKLKGPDVDTSLPVTTDAGGEKTGEGGGKKVVLWTGKYTTE